MSNPGIRINHRFAANQLPRQKFAPTRINMESGNLTIETSSTLIEHLMNIDGVVFREVRTQKPSKTAENREEISQQRSIGDKTYTVTIFLNAGNFEERKIETNMTPDELPEFEAKWNRLWQPSLLIAEWSQATDNQPSILKAFFYFYAILKWIDFCFYRKFNRCSWAWLLALFYFWCKFLHQMANTQNEAPNLNYFMSICNYVFF